MRGKAGHGPREHQFKVQRWELLWPSGKTGRTGSRGAWWEVTRLGESWTVVLGLKEPLQGLLVPENVPGLYRKEVWHHAGVVGQVRRKGQVRGS